MDEDHVNELGLAPIEDELAEVDAISNRDELIVALGQLGREGVEGLFTGFVNTDDKNSDAYIVYLGQGGLSLPDESYYRDEKFEEIRKAFVVHVSRMLELAGIPEAEAKAEQIMELETRLAKNHWDRVQAGTPRLLITRRAPRNWRA